MLSRRTVSQQQLSFLLVKLLVQLKKLVKLLVDNFLVNFFPSLNKRAHKFVMLKERVRTENKFAEVGRFPL